jgi:hypothetical protein
MDAGGVTYFWIAFDVLSAVSLALLFRSVVRTEMGAPTPPELDDRVNESIGSPRSTD